MGGIKARDGAWGAAGPGALRALAFCACALAAVHLLRGGAWGGVPGTAGAGTGVHAVGAADRWHSAAEKGAVLARLRGVLRVCGGLCDTAREVVDGPFMSDGRHFGVSASDVPCRGLYASEEVDAARETKAAPEDVPEELRAEFDMGGRVEIRKMYFDQVYLGREERVLQWTEEEVERLVGLVREGKYDMPKWKVAHEMLAEYGVKGKRVLVVGSETPWVEACALAAGAEEVVTLEYGAINSTHPRVRAMLPRELAQEYLDGRLRKFDFVAAWSSLEHPGLGRYGDALNPWGDIIAVAKAWCVTKKGGRFLMEVPYGRDAIVYNAHRVYGYVRTPYQMTNWKQISKNYRMEDARMYERMEAREV